MALIRKGWATAWAGSAAEACDLFIEGVRLITDPRVMVISLHALAERLARDGEGLLAWKLICVAETASLMTGDSTHYATIRWIKGITYRALEEYERAETELVAARREILGQGRTFKAGVLLLDLASVYAAQGRTRDTARLAEEAFAIFKAIGLEDRALAAYQAFLQAARAEAATSEMAAAIAGRLLHFRTRRVPSGA